MAPEKDEKSPLEEVRRRLYAPQGAAPVTVPGLHTEAPQPVEMWKQAPPPPPKKPGLPATTLFLIAAGVFFLIATMVAAFLILFGGRTVSTDNIEIAIANPPTTVGSGDTVEVLITVTNTNPVLITDTTLSVDFPEGTRAADAPTESYTHYSDTLGDIPAGEGRERTVRAVVFGSEGQKVQLPIRFEYRTAGSNSPFIKEVLYEFTITTAPLSISVGALESVSAGQPFTIAASVRSNAPQSLANAALLISYPPGFTPTKTTPQPIGGSLFDLGTLSPGEEKTVSVTGVLAGEDRDTRTFKFTSGTRSGTTSTTLAVSYTTIAKEVTLERTFLAPTLSLNRDTTSNLVLKTGQQVDALLSWVNTLSVPIQDAEITVALSGSALDVTSIKAANGYYRSGDTKIIFSKETIPSMADISPSETGSGTFYFLTKGGTAAQSLRNPTLTLSVSVAGRRLSERNVPVSVSSTITRTVKVESDLTLTSRALRTIGPIANTGPWPPTVDKESTYTIEWTLGSSVNSVGGARATAVLPSYVRFTGATSPTDGSVTYNATTRTVTWNAGDVPAGAEKKVHFQVGLVPSASQRGQTPVLITGQQVTGTDRFTETKLTGQAADVSILIPHDPGFTPAAGQVQ